MAFTSALGTTWRVVIGQDNEGLSIGLPCCIDANTSCN